MKQRLKMILVPVVALTLIACNQQSSSTKEAINDPARPRLATLSQQKMCADQAEKQFKVSNWSDDAGAEFDSHFDPQANVCYMMFHRSGMLEKTDIPTNSYLVFDAFEGRVYASFSWMNSAKKKYWEVAPIECSVKPRGQPEIKCNSAEEFEGLVDKYFGISR